MSRADRGQGIRAAGASALFLGLTPVFGKLAILSGLPALAVVALRTVGAAALLSVVMALFRRRHFYIYPLGLLGCLLAGVVNGTGSLLFYGSLARIDASLGQLLYSLYPIYVALLLYFDGYRYSKMTLLRLGLSLPALILLTAPAAGPGDTVGILMMIGAGLLYALHIPINQRVLYEAPAPTVTLYTLVAMTVVVVPVAAVLAPAPSGWQVSDWRPLLALTLITFSSRLTLFSGVKSLGGLDTALIGLGEIIVTLTLAYFWLGERLSAGQWLGALLLSASIFLVAFDRRERQRPAIGGWLRWLLPHAEYPVRAEGSSTPEERPQASSQG